MRVNKFVLDTNVWISYFITKTENELLALAFTNKLSILICEELIAELKRVLEYPHVKKYGINTKEAVLFVKRMSVMFELSYPIKSYIPGDENDNYIISLALQTNSGYITSGDKHILSEKKNLEAKYKKLKILTKAEFEKMF
jgi:hypothetical protein